MAVSDRKWQMHVIAEEIAEREYQVDFYSLSDDVKDTVWSRAEVEWMERAMARADWLNDAEREAL
jgi:hypothetical protein